MLMSRLEQNYDFFFFPFSITSFTLNFVIFEIKPYGIGFSRGNLIVPFDVSYPSNSFLNFATPLDVGKKLICSVNAAK